MFRKLKIYLYQVDKTSLTHRWWGGLLGKWALAMLASSDALSLLCLWTRTVSHSRIVSPLSSPLFDEPLSFIFTSLLLLASLTRTPIVQIIRYLKVVGAYMVTRKISTQDWSLIAGGSLAVDYSRDTVATASRCVWSWCYYHFLCIPALHPYTIFISPIFPSLSAHALEFKRDWKNLPSYSDDSRLPLFILILRLSLALWVSFNIHGGFLNYRATSTIGPNRFERFPSFTPYWAFTSGSASLTGVEAISMRYHFQSSERKGDAPAIWPSCLLF